MLEPVQQFSLLTQHGTRQQWLEWLGKQVFGVADQMETKQRMQQKQTEWLLTATKELEKARNQIRSLEEELARAKDF